MKILFLSHTFYGGNFRVGSHELSEIAIAQGHEVLHVSTPLSPFHYLRKLFVRNIETHRYDKNQLATWSRVPFIFLPLQYKFSKWLPGRHLRSIFNGEYDLVLIDQPYFLRYIQLLNPKARIILRLTDVISDRRQRSLVIKNIDHITGAAFTSDVIRRNLGLSTVNTMVIPNGLSLKASKVKVAGEMQHGMIYIGALDDRIDWEFIEQLSLSPNFDYLHLYGSGKIPTKLPRCVTFMGAIEFDKSFLVMSKYRFLVLPYKNSEANRGRSPMKLANAIRVGLTPLVPEWMRHHEQSMGISSALMSEIPIAGKSFTEINSNNQTLNLSTWEENFGKIVEWSMNIPKKIDNAT